MSIEIRLASALIFALTASGAAEARCKKSQVCDDLGMNCQVQDICDSSIDLPSVELAPLAPLPTTQLKPLPSMDLPPLGTSDCEYRQVNGQWQNVCR